MTTILFLLLSPAEPTCQGCGPEASQQQTQAVPAQFRFQARVAQGALPAGERTLPLVRAFLLAGNTVLCQEEHEAVQIQDSVLTLTVGGNGADLRCDLGRLVAENSGLLLKVCIGGSTNCLKPVALGSVPYAVHGSYVGHAQRTHSAWSAAVSRYANRASADRDALQSGTVETGYLAFETPSDATPLFAAAELLSSEYEPYSSDGYIQWAPLSSASPSRLNVCAKDFRTDAPMRLAALTALAKSTVASDDAFVKGSMVVGGGLELLGSQALGGQTQEVLGHANTRDDLTVDGDLVVATSPGGGTPGLQARDGALLTKGNAELSVESGFNPIVLRVGATKWAMRSQATVLATNLRVAAADLNEDGALDKGPHLMSKDKTYLLGDTNVGQASSFQHRLQVTAPTTLHAGATFLEDVSGTAQGGARHDLTAATIEIGKSAADVGLVTGEMQVAGRLTTTGAVAAARLLTASEQVRVTGQAKFAGEATIAGVATLNGASAFQGAVEFLGSVEVSGGVYVPGPGSVKNVHLNLATTCPAGTVAVGRASDGQLTCSRNISLGASGAVRLQSGAGGAMELGPVPAGGIALAVFGTASAAASLEVHEATSRLLRIDERGTTFDRPVQVYGNLLVGGTVEGMSIGVKTELGGKTKVLAAATATVTASCPYQTILDNGEPKDIWPTWRAAGGYASWYTPTGTGGTCASVGLPTGEHKVSAQCQRISRGRYSCDVKNLSNAALCVEPVVRCVRVRQ
jgi:hypothetical protein